MCLAYFLTGRDIIKYFTGPTIVNKIDKSFKY